MFRLIIQTIANTVVSLVRFVLSAKFLTTITLSFFFFVSIGAAEEKHVMGRFLSVSRVGEERQALSDVSTQVARNT